MGKWVINNNETIKIELLWLIEIYNITESKVIIILQKKLNVHYIYIYFFNCVF